MGTSKKYSLFATTAKGIENLLAEELTSLPGVSEVKVERAGASFVGDLEAAYRACLWSRTANRILLPVKSFPAPNPEKLYGGVKSIKWSDHLSAKGTLAVDFSSSHSQITHTHFGALKVKDAIVDQLRSVQGERPSIDVERPDVRVNVYLHEDHANVSIDLSGDSLHRRGYRKIGVPAPLKENLAAALILSTAWPKEHQNLSFMDPMTGSGTLPIEAAMIALDYAPGLKRGYYGFLGWKGHSPSIWNSLLDEAKSRIVTDRKKFPKIVGYDSDFRAVRVALQNSEQAELTKVVHFEKREFADCTPISDYGVIMINPPYGERLGEVEALTPLYKQMGDTFKQKFKGWTGYIFTGSKDLSKTVGLKTSQRLTFFNGAMECRLLKYEMYQGSPSPARSEGP
jgi:23S rRNA (guanine2445-N2)-methyltransferase / 23S rRNA (guanine2069-N7)-methyltransferase